MQHHAVIANGHCHFFSFGDNTVTEINPYAFMKTFRSLQLINLASFGCPLEGYLPVFNHINVFQYEDIRGIVRVGS